MCVCVCVCVSVQAAAVTMCQYLAMEVSKPGGLEQVWKTASREAKRLRAAMAVPPTPPARPAKSTKTKQKKSPAPPSPLVGRIMEMGFNRHQVEFAVRVTGGWGSVRGVGHERWAGLCKGCGT